ncbi:transcriptional regulator family: Fungal Specific TF [Penicillium roqueforti]|nr:transcriptional regulator family: Fungal Specific TF [Penicillium roqueforti]KAI2725931.1 transcriptional regulator family: Fungal Specific TF [Penicillium roqueforti]KAI3125202.1 transcriptional regulator family: Fungal Specific TF [Penicillium roqueforti]KAI3205564.1 transcriptional regulator family: Fungal Specific TF [Penicillium roqueforti]
MNVLVKGEREHREQIPRDMPTYEQMESGLCGRVSQWLWSGWRGTAFEGASPDLQKPYQLNHGDCKACREQHTTCDHTRPQCSHCWSQQLLCFYVDPKRRKQKNIRKATFSEVETSSGLIKDTTA